LESKGLRRDEIRLGNPWPSCFRTALLCQDQHFNASLQADLSSPLLSLPATYKDTLFHSQLTLFLDPNTDSISCSPFLTSYYAKQKSMLADADKNNKAASNKYFLLQHTYYLQNLKRLSRVPGLWLSI
jgi:hypothetical protein